MHRRPRALALVDLWEYANEGPKFVNELPKKRISYRPDLRVENRGRIRGLVHLDAPIILRPITGRFGIGWTTTAGWQCAFRVEKKHLNGQRHVHGGAFMSFADYCLFAMASPLLQGPGRDRVVFLRIPRRRARARTGRMRREITRCGRPR